MGGGIRTGSVGCMQTAGVRGCLRRYARRRLQVAPLPSLEPGQAALYPAGPIAPHLRAQRLDFATRQRALTLQVGRLGRQLRNALVQVLAVLACRR